MCSWTFRWMIIVYTLCWSGSTVAAEVGPYERTDDFVCDNKRCISHLKLCDGAKDCLDASDETAELCINESCPTNVRCNYGGCIADGAYCDGNKDCYDMSDESNCDIDCSGISCLKSKMKTCIEGDYLCDGKKDCDGLEDESVKACFIRSSDDDIWCHHQFRCDYGYCIDDVKMCDGTIDCLDGSDETEKLCWNNTCKLGEFKCNYGACISGERKCNGEKDCRDNSDESSKLCSATACNTEMMFRCKYGACIPMENFCDGFSDCIDGSDEQMCANDELHNFNRRNCSVPDGKIVILETDEARENGFYPAGTLAELKCSEGYSLFGDKTILCQRYGSSKAWNSTATCTKMCPEPAYRTAKAKCDGKICSGYQVSGTTIHLECKDGHTPGYTVQNTICTNGIWEYTGEPCKQKCGKLLSDRIGKHYKTPAALSEIPWHAIIYQENMNDDDGYSQICGGTILNNVLVVSAAHCFYKSTRVPNPDEYMVGAGKIYRKYQTDHDVKDAKQIVAVKNIFLHNQFVGLDTFLAHDIAFLKLAETLIFNDFVIPICLKDDNKHLMRRRMGLVAGMGKEPQTDSIPETLQRINLPWVDFEMCKSVSDVYYVNFLHNKLCVGLANGTELCHGDSGGGFAMHDDEGRWYLVGVLSSLKKINDTDQCDQTVYSAFTLLEHEKTFIQDVIKEIVIPLYF